MSCPKCRTGVLEQIGVIQIANENEMKINLTKDFTQEGIKIMVCSFDECGHTEMRATPGILSTAKKIMRERDYARILAYQVCP